MAEAGRNLTQELFGAGEPAPAGHNLTQDLFAAPPAAVASVSPWTPVPATTGGPPPTLDADIQRELAPAQRGMRSLLIGGPAGVGTVRQAAQTILPKVASWFTAGANDPATVGEIVGTTVVPGPWKPVAGAVGAGAGEGVRQWWSGEPFDAAKMGKEAALSALPEVFESAGRAAVKTAARGTTSGKALMREEAAQQARQVPERVFAPRPEGEISQAFETVRRAGVQVDSTDVVRRLQTMPPGKQAALMDELAWIDDHNRTGGRYTALLENLQKPSTTNQIDLGQLQDLRSQVRKRAAQLPEGEAQQLLRDFQESVDNVIYHAPATGAHIPETRETLRQARQDWARRMAADDMSDLLEDKIRSSPDLSMVSLNLAGFYDQLRRGKSEISRSVDRAIDLMPGGRERFETAMQDVAQQFQYVNLPKVPGMQQALSLIMLSPTWRERLRGAIVEGRGTVSPNAFAVLANAARRELMPELTGAQQAPPPEGVQSWFAPGGVARSTD